MHVLNLDQEYNRFQEDRDTDVEVIVAVVIDLKVKLIFKHLSTEK